MSRNSFLTAVVAAGAWAVLAPLAAQAQVTIIREIAPPPAVVETVPESRPGYVWAPGHQELRDGQYVWVKGHWVVEREGYVYRPGGWERRDGRWVYLAEAWTRQALADRDDNDRYSQGVDPNGPDGPYGDRDGDGVPNYRDRHPDNRHSW